MEGNILLNLKEFKSKYLAENPHTSGVRFYRTKEKRISMEDVPEGFWRYRLRHKDNSPNKAASLEKSVIVNHYCDVLADKKIDYLEQSKQHYIPLYK